jgi:hypothetical protein
LPHSIGGFRAPNTGEAVDVVIGAPQARLVGAEALEIDPVTLFPDMTRDAGLPARVQTFRDAAAEAFDWISSQGVCVGDLYVYWRSGGGGTGAQSEGFQQWLVPSREFPEVTCEGGACRFVGEPAGASTPEEALFAGSGTAASNWTGACSPPDGSGLAIYQACYRFEEQRENTIRYALLINQPPNRGGPRLDTFTVFVRQYADGWKPLGDGACSGDCPWPH